MKPVFINTVDYIYILSSYQASFYLYSSIDCIQKINNAGNYHRGEFERDAFLLLFKSFIFFLTVVILATQIHLLISLPLVDDEYSGNVKRADNTFLPNGNFSLVTNDKLLKLKELADAAHDPKVHSLFRVVNHYVQMAKKNHEYVLWKYDPNEKGFVLALKQNLNGILYYG